MRHIVCAAIALACTTLIAQTPLAKPQFEVVSVKPTAPGSALPPMLREVMRNQGQPGAIAFTGSDRVRLRNSTLLDLIATAFSVRAAQVSGPDWLSDQGFDIEAKVPDGTPKEQLNAMLQSLLEDRFGLKVHRATQAQKGFALIVGKDGPKLKPAPVSRAELTTAPAEPLTEEEKKAALEQFEQKFAAGAAVRKKRTQERLQELQQGGAPLVGYNTQSLGSITTEDLAAYLIRPVGAPVVDQTGMTGKYSVTIETWQGGIPGGTIFDAVEKLGLKLESRKVTVDTLVVDQVSKSPTAN